jgi:CO/xanthine dehydrogenase Mo-binding subunit
MNNLSPHAFRSADEPSRRGFLITMMGAGIMLGYARKGLADQSSGSTGDLFEPTIWYGIDRSGAVTVNIVRAELGQHVGTSLARIVADELEADWGKVKIILADTDPKWGLMITGGSLSVWQSFPVLSRAGAAGRIALIEEGAKLLGVSPQNCTARNGVVHAKGSSILYGDIVARGNMRRTFTPEQLQKIAIKLPADRRLIGHDTMALDIPSKTNGEGRYGIDAVVEGMIYARPKVPPTRYDSKVVSIDDSAAKHLPGYIQSLALDDPSGTVPGWVMVYANSFATASRAADLVKVTWKSGDAAHVSERDLQNRAAQSGKKRRRMSKRELGPLRFALVHFVPRCNGEIGATSRDPSESRPQSHWRIGTQYAVTHDLSRAEAKTSTVSALNGDFMSESQARFHR